MGSYIDIQGNYYVGDRIHLSDIAVPERPSMYHEWLNNEWVFNREYWLDMMIRPQRNVLLDQIDIIHCNALNLRLMTEEQITAWQTYKQALRDITKNIDPESPVWPAQPT